MLPPTSNLIICQLSTRGFPGYLYIYKTLSILLPVLPGNGVLVIAITKWFQRLSLQINGTVRLIVWQATVALQLLPDCPDSVFGF